MARCIIICPLWHGERMTELCLEKGDLLLCADGGYSEAIKRGLIPDMIIGDFDTLPMPQLGDIPIRQLPIKKDDTDLGASIQEGRIRGYKEFLLLGCIGGRLDHTLAMLQLMADGILRGESFRACDAENDVRILGPGRYTLERQEGRLLSLLSFGESVNGVSLTGTVWPLSDAVLTNRFPLGISNEINEDRAELCFTDGLLMLIRSVNHTCK